MELDFLPSKSRFEAKTGARLESTAPVLLVVEDDYDWTYLFCDEFKKMAPDWELLCAREGWAAMHQLTKGLMPQALVVDVDMVGVGCRDLIEWVKEQTQFCSLPVVVLSNSNDPSHRQRCAALGVSSYLDKPGSLKALRNNIRYIVKLCGVENTHSKEWGEMSCL